MIGPEDLVESFERPPILGFRSEGMGQPSVKTVKRLFAECGNRCAFPKCSTPMVDSESGSIVGEICHIKGKSPSGPRFDASQTEDQRHGYDNLFLLCSPHHKIFDDDPIAYTVERLRNMKHEHREQVADAGGPAIDDEFARTLIDNMNATVIGGSDSPNSHLQQASEVGGHVIQTGDNSPVNIRYLGESPKLLVPVLDGVINDPNVFVRIHNADSYPHQFKVVFHGVSGMAGKPRVRDSWLPWNCGDFQLVGPQQSGNIQVAQADGESRDVGKVIRFIHDKERQYDGRLSEYVAFGGQLYLDLELQSDAELAIQGRRMWTLAINDAGTPIRFTPQ